MGALTRPPGPLSVAVADEASQSCDQRARREVEWVSVRDSTTTPIVGVPPTAPTPLPASSGLASARFTHSSGNQVPAGARVHPRPVGPTLTVPAPPDRVRRRRGSLTLGGTR
jgi:hypothetical protein